MSDTAVLTRPDEKEEGIYLRLNAVGTILTGKAMLPQIIPELRHWGLERPALLTSADNKRKARKAARILASAFGSGIAVHTGTPAEDADCLILAGDRSLAESYGNDERPKVLIPLSLQDLDSLHEPCWDFLVLDSRFVGKSSSGKLESFFASLIYAATGGLAHHPSAPSIPEAFVFSNPTELIAGEGCLKELPVLMDRMGMSSPLILSDKGIREVGLLDLLLQEGDLEDVVVFDGIPPDSHTAVVNEAANLFREKGCDGIIALGGGSVLDTGKAVYLNVSTGSNDLASWAGSNHIPRLRTPFIAIPTTSGTGSELTKVAVVSDEEKGRKILYVSSHLQPDYALLDSRLSCSLPPFLTSITGMDALSHAVEAYTCLGKNPISDQLAWKAIELIRDNLIPLMDDPGNKLMRQNMALASSLAGAAFSNSMVGMVHTIGHSVGALCHAPHGSCMAVLLAPSLEYNFPKIKGLLAELLPVLAGIGAEEGLTEVQAAEKTIETVRRMNAQLNEKTGGRHPVRLGDIIGREGEALVSPEDFPEIARLAMGDASIAYNPVELNVTEILEVLKKAY